MTSAGPLLILGSGGFAVETIEVVNAINSSGGTIELIGVADDDVALHGQERLGVPVIGSIEASVRKYDDALLITTMGNPSAFTVRRKVVNRLGLSDERFATLIHPTAVVPSSASIGVGSVVQANVVMTADVVIGRHVLVMPAVVLTHADRIGDYVTIASGAKISGEVRIDDEAYIGAGSLIRERLTIGARSLVGLGAIVLDDVPPEETWVGNPARRLPP